jgi:hypothetical protein
MRIVGSNRGFKNKFKWTKKNTSCNFSRRSNWAFAATMRVERLIVTALHSRSWADRAPSGRSARCNRDGDKVMAARPNHFLSGRRYQTRPKKTELDCSFPFTFRRWFWRIPDRVIGVAPVVKTETTIESGAKVVIARAPHELLVNSLCRIQGRSVTFC